MQVRSTRHAKTPQRTTALTNLCFAIFASELCFPSLLTVLAYSGCSSVESMEFGLDFQDAEIGSTETPVWEDYTLKTFELPSPLCSACCALNRGLQWAHWRLRACFLASTAQVVPLAVEGRTGWGSRRSVLRVKRTHVVDLF